MFDDRRVEIYRDKAGEWRWRVLADRGNLPDEIIAEGGEGYRNKAHARRMVDSLFEALPVEFLDGD